MALLKGKCEMETNHIRERAITSARAEKALLDAHAALTMSAEHAEINEKELLSLRTVVSQMKLLIQDQHNLLEEFRPVAGREAITTMNDCDYRFNQINQILKSK